MQSSLALFFRTTLATNFYTTTPLERVKWRNMGRAGSRKRILLRHLVTDLIKYERIRTTVAKARAMRTMAERMITLAKKGDLNARRSAATFVYKSTTRGDPQCPLKKLFRDLGPRFLNRTGGYTRVLLDGYRVGDAAPMALIEYLQTNGERPPLRPKFASRSRVEADIFAQAPSPLSTGSSGASEPEPEASSSTPSSASSSQQSVPSSV
eukprot:gnl/Spiro4/10421_TR5573_c0_g1_i1.p1 gnl/Spiro4/10421_TR5573_c0_g1~~gnl/Spiro4/10421_TR5573_c0_g1_i1.p1  ORF type:complete len:209 (+),score=22.60 gnl/Spiro4/10421_TR5573_c0_g1_i1:62-688(+)